MSDAALLRLYTGVDGQDHHRRRRHRRRRQKDKVVLQTGLPRALDTNLTRSGAGRLPRNCDITPLMGNLTAQEAGCMATRQVQAHKRAAATGADALVASLLQARALQRERRQRAAVLRDCVQVYMAGLRRAGLLLAREREALRNRARDVEEEEAVVLEVEARAKSDLVCQVSRLQGDAGAHKGDLLVMERLLRESITALVRDLC